MIDILHGIPATSLGVPIKGDYKQIFIIPYGEGYEYALQAAANEIKLQAYNLQVWEVGGQNISRGFRGSSGAVAVHAVGDKKP